MNKELNKEQIDALREVVSIGAGNAATALSKMIGKKVDIEVPEYKLCGIDEVADIFGGAEVPVASVYLELKGDALGVILFSCKIQEAVRLSAGLLNLKNAGNELTEMGISAIKETSTILSGAFLGAMSQILKKKFLVSFPAFTQDMAGAVIDNILIETSRSADHAMILDTKLKIEDKKIEAYFFFIPEADFMEQILKDMGV